MYKFTDEQKLFLESKVEDSSIKELVKLFNEEFQSKLTYHQIYSYIYYRGLTIGKSSKPQHKWTVKQHEFLKEAATEVSAVELVELFNSEFGTNLTFSQVINYKRRHCWKNNRVGEEIGTEREKISGVIEVKIAKGNGKKDWKSKHVLIWEKHNKQEVPKGHVVIFGDRNNRNFDINNLVLVSQRQLAMLNKNGLIKNDVELTKIGVTLAEIQMKMKEKQNRN